MLINSKAWYLMTHNAITANVKIKKSSSFSFALTDIVLTSGIILACHILTYIANKFMYIHIYILSPYLLKYALLTRRKCGVQNINETHYIYTRICKIFSYASLTYYFRFLLFLFFFCFENIIEELWQCIFWTVRYYYYFFFLAVFLCLYNSLVPIC